MSDRRNEVVEVLSGFGFDEFMVGQIFQALMNRELILTEPLGDSYSKVRKVLEDYLPEEDVLGAITELIDSGVVFRER